jgi:hypothetical protein
MNEVNRKIKGKKITLSGKKRKGKALWTLFEDD